MKEKITSPIYPAWIIVVSQVLIYFISAIPLRLWYRARKRLPENSHLLRRGSLIVANHQSMVDPFFIVMNLPFFVYIRLLPLHFPTADWAYQNRWFNPPFLPFLKLLGCFTIGTTSTSKMHAFFYIRELLTRSETVILFPEGQITDQESVKELKKGIDFFLKSARNVMFVRLRGFNILQKSERRRISFGDVFEPPPTMDLKEIHAYLQKL